MQNECISASGLTGDMPMIFRNSPDPKDKANASKMPIIIANSKAVDTEGSCILSATPSKGLPLLLFSKECFSEKQPL